MLRGTTSITLCFLAVGGALLAGTRGTSEQSTVAFDTPGDPAPSREPPPGTPPGTPEGLYYDIVYARAPRHGDEKDTRWPEVKTPINLEAGTDLMLLHPDGSEEVLVAGGKGAVVDPFPSFDGRSVYYAKFPSLEVTSRNVNAPAAGSDIFKINVETRQVVRLTHQEFTPNSGASRRSKDPRRSSGRHTDLGYGVFNLGPTPLPGGRVMFTSSRNGFLPNKSFTFPNLQLHVMDSDGSNVELIGHLNLGSALHPTILHDGRVMFSSYETQGLRNRRLWGLWSIFPDGRYWEPLLSAFERPTAFHFQAQMSDGQIVVVDYYNQNNNGFGTLVKFPHSAPPGLPKFGRANPRDESNPRLAMGRFKNGKVWWESYPFSPFGLSVVTPFAHAEDQAASKDNEGLRMGKVTHPAAAPHNGLLLVWSPGPVNSKTRPTPKPYYDGGLYWLAGGKIAEHPRDLVLLKNDPRYNEMQPRPLVPYRDIYGIDQPFRLSWLPNDGKQHKELPRGTPFGLIGTSSFYRRATAPGQGSKAYGGLDAFNTSKNQDSSNWLWQGADSGKYDNQDIWAVRIVAMEPTSDYGSGRLAKGRHFRNYANERLRVLGEVPLRKNDPDGKPLLDADGNPDTSFLAKIPADTPFTFQTLDRNGLVLNSSQTWHHLRPGEIRSDCGGCHAHDQTPLDFNTTAASRPDYVPWDLTQKTTLVSQSDSGTPTLRVASVPVVNVEFYRDIRPILERSCVTCHTGKASRPPGGLVLDERSLYDGLPGDYVRLAEHAGGKWGYPAIIKNGIYREPNASRYIRKFQSRRSLLIWKLFGKRLDGWTNDDHPTESVPGDRSTLPEGADPNLADIDFDGVSCPPPGSDAPPLTPDEKITFGRWIDFGAPINSGQETGHGEFGWFLDNLRPTLTVSQPRSGHNPDPISEIRVGAFDAYSGLDSKSFSVKADFRVNSQNPGKELARFLVPVDDHIWVLRFEQPVHDLRQGKLTVSVRDQQGNLTRIERTFSVG